MNENSNLVFLYCLVWPFVDIISVYLDVQCPHHLVTQHVNDDAFGFYTGNKVVTKTCHRYDSVTDEK